MAALCGLTLIASTAPHAPAEEAGPDQAVVPINQLGLDLHRLLAKDSGNLCISPLSIQNALAMTWAGAAGDTMEQMRQVLHYGDNEEALHELMSGLTGRIFDPEAAAEDEGSALLAANRLFPMLGFEFRDEFMANLREWYGAEPELLDFAGATEASRLRINSWVEEQTRDRIKDLLPEGSINNMTRLVLVNALYFNMPWAQEFSEMPDQPFLAPDGAAAVPFMHLTKRFHYLKDAGFERVAIPYKDSDLQFVIWLPDAGSSLAELEQSLDAATLGDTTSGAPTLVNLWMPPFKIEGDSVSLKAPLQQLGMTLPFDEARADFTRMESSGLLFVSDVVHKTFIAVDKEGTEAAAATGVVVQARSARIEPEPLLVKVDRPFLYAIQDSKSGAVLFLGRVVKP